MPASVVPILASREGTYVLVEAALPSQPPQVIGVLLADPASDRAWLRMRNRYDNFAEAEDAEVLEALEQDMRARLAERRATSTATSARSPRVASRWPSRASEASS